MIARHLLYHLSILVSTERNCFVRIRDKNPLAITLNEMTCVLLKVTRYTFPSVGECRVFH